MAKIQTFSHINLDGTVAIRIDLSHQELLEIVERHGGRELFLDKLQALFNGSADLKLRSKPLDAPAEPFRRKLNIDGGDKA